MATPRVTSAQLSWYRKGVNQTAKQAGQYVRGEILTRAAFSDVAETRNLTIEIIKDSVDMFGDVAQDYSNQLFDNIMKQQGSNKRAEIIDHLIEDEYIEEKVHYFAEQLVEGDTQGYLDSVEELMDYYVKRSGFEGMRRNSTGNHVRWARIPGGSETCAWCLMLCSRGFVYHSEETADGGGYHNHCMCMCIPSADAGGIEVDDYDPDYLTDRYREGYRAAKDMFDLSSAETPNMKQILKGIESVANDKGWDYMYGRDN